MKQVTSWSPTIVTQLGHKWLPSAFEKSNPPSEDQYAINCEDYRQMRYAHPWGQHSPLGQHRKVHTPVVAVWKGATHKWNHQLCSLFHCRPWTASGVRFPCSLFSHLVPSLPSHVLSWKPKVDHVVSWTIHGWRNDEDPGLQSLTLNPNSSPFYSVAVRKGFW